MQSQDGNAKQEKRDGFYLRGFPKNPSKYRYDINVSQEASYRPY